MLAAVGSAHLPEEQREGLDSDLTRPAPVQVAEHRDKCRRWTACHPGQTQEGVASVSAELCGQQAERRLPNARLGQCFECCYSCSVARLHSPLSPAAFTKLRNCFFETSPTPSTSTRSNNARTTSAECVTAIGPANAAAMAARSGTPTA